MLQVKDLTEFTVRDLWAEVKEEEEWWGDLKQETVRVVKRLLEGALEGGRCWSNSWRDDIDVLNCDGGIVTAIATRVC